MPRSYNGADWFWIVATDLSASIYASRRFTYVTTSDPEYLAFLADGNKATLIPTEAELRDVLANWDVPFQTQPLPPLEEKRPRVPAARLRLVCQNQSIPDTTATQVVWTSSTDPLGMVNLGGNADRIVIPTRQGGTYLCTVSVSFAANATGDREIRLTKNGNPIRGGTIRFRAPAAMQADMFGTRPVQLDAGDILRLVARQTSGVALLTDFELTLDRNE